MCAQHHSALMPHTCTQAAALGKDVLVGLQCCGAQCCALILIRITHPLLQASAPQPADAAVRVVRDPGGLFAAAVFNGVATPRAAAAAAAELTTALEAAGLVPAEPGAWTLARYNDPSVPARLRRNEVLVRLSDFDLWV